MTMDHTTRVDRVLPELFTELADARTPAYLEAAIERASSRPQRPAWSFPGRWLPMEISTRVAPATRMPWRTIGVLALIAVLIAASLAVYVGQQSRTLPAPPFGPAANGSVAYTLDGDIVVADPITGETTTILSGADNDKRPVFSHDGSLIAFQREQLESGQLPGGNTPADIFVARANGSDPVRMTTEPLRVTPSDVGHPYQFSPDGTLLAIAGEDPQAGSGILLAATDGSDARWLDLSSIAGRVSAVTEPNFRPPDGAELSFVGFGPGAGIYAIDLASGAIRPIVESGSGQAMDLARWSPDGSRLSYNTWRTDGSGGLTVRVHVVGADGTGDIALPLPADAVWQVGGAWSNDGSRMHVVRGYSGDWQGSRPAILPADGSDPGQEVAFDGTIQGGCCNAWTWSPDDTMVLGRPIDTSGRAAPQVMIDVAAGTIAPAPWSAINHPAWQRVAP